MLSTESPKTEEKIREPEDKSNLMEVDPITNETRLVESSTTQLSGVTVHIPEVSSVTSVSGILRILFPHEISRSTLGR